MALLLNFPRCTPGLLPYATSLVYQDRAGRIHQAMGLMIAKSANHAIALLTAAVRQQGSPECHHVVNGMALHLCDPITACYTDTKP
jgi:hypothetical protein